MKARHEFGTEAMYLEYLQDYNATAAMKAELSAQTVDGKTYLWSDVDALAERAYTVAQAMVQAKTRRQ